MKYSLTDEHRARLRPWAERWIANALNTSPMSAEDRAAMVAAMDGLYRAADLEPPTRGVFCAGPISGAIAASVAAGVWWLRENPHQHTKLFGRQVSEAELMAAIPLACARAARVGMAAIRGEPSIADETADRAVAVTDAATRAATRVATDAATEAAARDAQATSRIAGFLVACTQHWYRMRDGGNQWSALPAYLSFFRHVVALDLPEYEKWQHYEAATIHGGPRYMHARFWIVSDRPEFIHRDEQNRPHCADGPFTRWRDGFALFCWHGVRVPAKVIEAPESYAAKELAAEENSEVHRALAECLGWEKYLALLGVDRVDEWTDAKTGLRYELLEPKVRVGELQPRYLRMQSPPLNDGSQPHFLEPVDPELRTAQAARKWQIKLSSDPAARYYRHGDVVVTYAPPESLYWPTAAECNENPNLEFVEER